MRNALLLAAMTIGSTLGAAQNACAYLGSFGPNDGYYPQYGTVLGDVTYYNAGQSGANAGGGPTMPLPADTGLWKLQTPVGATFGNPVNRAAFTAGYPSYNPTPPNTIPVYLLGGHFPGRNNDGYNLAFRNDNPIGTGAARYRYAMDTYDTGGVIPSTVISGPVSMSFFFRPNPADAPPSNGALSDVKFTMSVLGTGGVVGFQWGYARDNTIMWRDSSSNPWNYTSFVGDQGDWDGVTFKLDLTAKTFSINYYDASALTTSVLVPAGTPMGLPMPNFVGLDWQLEDGVNAAANPNVGGKNYFDDFSFAGFPEPASMTALAGATMIAGARRRSSTRSRH